MAALQAVIVDTGAQAEAEATITALTEQAVAGDRAGTDRTARPRDELIDARVLRGLARPLRRQLAGVRRQRVFDRRLDDTRLAHDRLEPGRLPPRATP